MPQATDLVVNNGATTPVSKTFTLLAPSAGYNSIAEWALKEGTISAVFPRFTSSVRPVSGRKSSKVQLKLKIPSSYTDSVTGLTRVGSAFDANLDVTMPDDFPETLKNDAVAFLTNIINTALVKAIVRDMSPAT